MSPSTRPVGSSTSLNTEDQAAAKRIADYLQFLKTFDAKVLNEKLIQAEQKAKSSLDKHKMQTLWREQNTQTLMYEKEYKYLEAFDNAFLANATLARISGSKEDALPTMCKRLQDTSGILYRVANTFLVSHQYNATALRQFLDASQLSKSINTPMREIDATEFKNTPLHLALGIENIQFANALLLACADLMNPNIQDSQGKSAFLLAVKMGNSAVVETFLMLASENRFNPPLDINLRDNQGRTALHYACAIGRPDLVQKLLKQGANPNIPDHSGKKPIEMASCSEEEILEIFNSVGINAQRDQLAPLNENPYPTTSYDNSDDDEDEQKTEVFTKVNVQAYISLNPPDAPQMKEAQEQLSKLTGKSLVDAALEQQPHVRALLKHQQLASNPMTLTSGFTVDSAKHSSGSIQESAPAQTQNKKQ